MVCHRLTTAKKKFFPANRESLFYRGQDLIILALEFFFRPILIQTPTLHGLRIKALSLLLLAGLFFLSPQEIWANDQSSQIWQQYLQTQLKLLENEITDNPVMLQAVSLANQDNSHLTQVEILQIDKQWQRTEGVDLFIVSLITNTLANELKALQKKHRGLVEILMTDQRGLLIAATNKTSDYYQADEDWWQKAVRVQGSNGFLGQLEYDESALVDVTPVYLVLRDKQKSIIGVVKVVYSMNRVGGRGLEQDVS